MAINIGQLIETVFEDVTLVEIDSATLAAGQAVEVPGHIQVGSVGGKAVYLYGTLSTNGSWAPSSNPQPTAADVSITNTAPAPSAYTTDARTDAQVQAMSAQLAVAPEALSPASSAT